jgi:hypothetical protein
MIRPLVKFTDLAFPVVLMKKYKKLEDSRGYIHFDDKSIYKQGNIFNTFNLLVYEPPETYETFQTPEALLTYKGSLRQKVLLDDNLNIWLPHRQIKIEMCTKQLTFIRQDYIQIWDIPYYLPKAINQDKPLPLIAKVEGLYFHVGWSKKPVRGLSHVI